MKVIRNENIIFTDIDDTIIMHNYPLNAETVTIDFYGEKRTFGVHSDHVKLLKNYRARGFIVIAWSGNGYKHTETVINALGINDYVDYVMTKPNRVIDDSEPNNWAPRIYIPYK